jgi:CubicO group peptidase (beta-lactamase class C family)
MDTIDPRFAVRRSIAFAASLILLTGGCGGSGVVPPPGTDGFVAYLDATVPDLLEEHRVPGLTIALVRDGDLAWSGAYGVRDATTAEPMRPGDLLQVASVSKSVTAYAVVRLAQEGLLDLDAPIGDYLSRWQLPESSHDTDGVTARRLLSHTAGLSTEGYPGLAPGDLLPTLEASLDGATGADPVELVQAPGAGHRYSGGGYTVVQLALEEITGRSFADHLAETVFATMGMAGSTYDQAPPGGASPHGSDGAVIEGRRFVELAAAGLWSTAPDLARFLAAGILDPDPATGLGADRVSEMLAPAAATDGSHALGFFVEQHGDGPVVVGHAGANAGWRSKILAIPELDAGIVILLNGEGGEAIHVELGCTWIAATAVLPSIDAACP